LAAGSPKDGRFSVDMDVDLGVGWAVASADGPRIGFRRSDQTSGAVPS